MGLRINQNIEAVNAHRNLLLTASSLSKSMEKLSSGLRINRAADDAAGLAISEKLRGQVKGLNQAIRNAQDGISLIQTAEGALNETHSILQRMRELAVQASNGTLNSGDRGAIQKEITSLVAEVDRIATTTEFNTSSLLNGSATNLSFQIGANGGQAVTITIANAGSSALGLNPLGVSTTDLSTATGANAAIGILDNAIKNISDSRADLGAVQNRLEHTIANLGVASENLAASESRVRDVDMAQEMMTFTKTQILQQAGTAMLAQANQTPQSVLQLLR